MNGKRLLALSLAIGLRLTLTLRAQTVSTLPLTGLNEPYGVAVDLTTNLYYLTDSVNNRVVSFNPANGQQAELAGGALFNPEGIVVAHGGLVVADSGNHAIRFISFQGAETTLAGGTPGFADGSGPAAQFHSPAGLAVDNSNGNVFIADLKNNAIRLLRGPNNAVTTYATGFYEPAGVAVGDNGVVFVADTRNQVIKMISTNGGVVTIAGQYRINGLQDAANGTDAQFNFPRGLLWLGGQTGLLVGDSGNQMIRRVYQNPNRNVWSVETFAGPFNVPIGLATDANGLLLVVESSAPGSLSSLTRPAVTLNLGFAATTLQNAVTIAFTNSPGAVTRYTADGSDPNPLSTLLPNGTVFDGGPPGAGPIFRLKARAFSPDGMASDVVSNTLTFVIGDPVASPSGAATNNAITAALSSVTTNAFIYWTYDGSQPARTNGSLYVGGAPLPLNASGVLKAQAFKNGYLDSATTTNVFTFTVSSPVITPVGAITNNAVTVSLATATTNALIYWTIDGSEPSPTNGTLYANVPFSLETSGVLKAKAFKPGYTDSVTASALFQFTVTDPVISPPGLNTNNAALVSFSTPTLGASLYYTLDGTEPTPKDGTPYAGPFQLAYNSPSLKVKGFKTGYLPSQTIAVPFLFTVSNPSLSISGGSFSNVLALTITSLTTNPAPLLRFTTDGSAPTLASPVWVNGIFGVSGALQVRAFAPFFTPSDVISNQFNFFVDTPVINSTGVKAASSGAYLNAVTNTIMSATVGAQFFYTLDGSDPRGPGGILLATANNLLVITTNSSLTVVGATNGFATSAPVSRQFTVQVPTPSMSPFTGYLPQGATVTLSDTRPDATIYYRLDGLAPTTNDTLYTGPISLDQISNPGQDLRVLAARAFAPNTLPSDLVTGRPAPINSIGVPSDLVAGIGASIVVPIVLNLQSNQPLKSLQFRAQISPATPFAPNLPFDLRAVPITTNDFVTVVGPSAAGNASLSSSAYSVTSGSGVTTNVLLISAIGTNANFAVQDFGTVAMLQINIPPTANLGDAYRIEILQASGTTNGQQGAVFLTNLPPRTITVSNVVYLVGDTSPGRWYNAGDFGNGDLDNADVNNAFYASLGIRLPYNFTDVFDAMDAYPDDTPGSVGGDGQIRFLDWQRILRRSLRRDTNNWQRSWTTNGFRAAIATKLPGEANLPGDAFSGLAGQVVRAQAQLSPQSLGNLAPGDPVRVPIYVDVAAGSSLAGLQFRASIAPVGLAPPLQDAAQFLPFDGLPQPLQAGGLPVNEVSAAWSLLLNPFTATLTGRQLLGAIAFTVPGAALPGATYQIQFANADGSPDENTQYDVAGGVAFVTVQAPAPPALAALPGFKLTWYAAAGQRYAVESTTNLTTGPWTQEGTELFGRGRTQEFRDQNASPGAKFYRVRTAP